MQRDAVDIRIWDLACKRTQIRFGISAERLSQIANDLACTSTVNFTNPSFLQLDATATPENPPRSLSENMSAQLRPSPTVLLPNLPPKTLVGIDLITFTSTPNFHGIRDLPIGWHFLYTGTTESLSLRCGAWFHVGYVSATEHRTRNSALAVTGQRVLEPEIYIWKWSSDTEALNSLNAEIDLDRQDAMRYKANLGAIWKSGGLFRYRSRVSQSMLSNPQGSAQSGTQVEEDDETDESGRRDWQQLTDHISPALLSRIIGSPEVDVDGHQRWVVTSAQTAGRDADHIPGVDSPAENADGMLRLSDEQEREFGFLPVDLKRTWREGAIGRERTDAAQDRSWALGDLIRRYSGPDSWETGADERSGEAQIIGELQFAFLMVLTMMNFSCLQQWKRLLEIVLTSRQAILDRETFMRDILRLLLCQLQRCDDVEGGLFDIDGDEGGVFLRNLLKRFRRSADQCTANGASTIVKTELDKLESWVKEEYDWDLKREVVVRRGMLQLEDGEQIEMDLDDNDEYDETGEYAPMVVDLGDGTTISQERSLHDTQLSDNE